MLLRDKIEISKKLLMEEEAVYNKYPDAKLVYDYHYYYTSDMVANNVKSPSNITLNLTFSYLSVSIVDGINVNTSNLALVYHKSKEIRVLDFHANSMSFSSHFEESVNGLDSFLMSFLEQKILDYISRSDLSLQDCHIPARLKKLLPFI